MLIKNDEERLFLEQLSHEDFLHIGLNQVAYVKPTKGANRQSYAVHAADGTQISVMESYDTAIAAVRFNDLHLATLQ